MDRYAFLLHPWFQTTGPVGFYVYTAARLYAQDLGLDAIPVRVMTTLVPTVARPLFADTVKALIGAGAFVRQPDAIQVIVPQGTPLAGSLSGPSPDPVTNDDDRRERDRQRKAAWRAKVRT
jgi:hypothetical protein